MKHLSNKIKKPLFIFFFSFIMIALLLVPTYAANNSSTKVVISVDAKLIGNEPPEIETFTFTLTPTSENNPMPDGTNGNKVMINGIGSTSFAEITYTRPGIYAYKIKEQIGNKANYVYDSQIYNVTVYITVDNDDNLASYVVITKESSNDKLDKVVFTNEYKKVFNPMYPQTGDTSNPILWIALASISAFSIVILVVINKKEKSR